MRLWSIHPVYLDAKGLVALWREGLLAQKVLLNLTKGYKNHPQLKRFKETANPLETIAAYLFSVIAEADKREYAFNRSKIYRTYVKAIVTVTHEQVSYEFEHLLAKLKNRNLDQYQKLKGVEKIKVHPLFKKVNGPVEVWEKRPQKKSMKKTAAEPGTSEMLNVVSKL